VGHDTVAATTVGHWLRDITFGHVRQLDRVSETMLTRAWAAAAGPDHGALVVDVDSTIVQVHGKRKQGASYGYTRQLPLHPLVATRADTGEVLHVRTRKGSATPPVVRCGSSPKRKVGSAAPARQAASCGGSTPGSETTT
jgi:hypothetical protein